MSYKAIDWAWDIETPTSASKLVLLALAKFASNDDKNECYPSIETLSKITRLDRRSVMKSLSILQKMEVVVIEKKYGAKNYYTLKTSSKNDTADSKEPVAKMLPVTNTIPVSNLHKTSSNFVQEPVAKILPVTKTIPVSNLHKTSSNFVQEPVAKMLPEYINNKSENKSLEKENKKEKEVEPSFELTPVEKPSRRKSLIKPITVTQQTWDDFNAIRKARKAPLTETALVRIQNEADKAGINLETALQICCVRGWQSFNHTWDWQDKTTSTRKRQPESLEPDWAKVDYGESGLLSDFKF